ncbi:hypothetical protein ABFP44_32160 [Paraburkholderia terricola]
MNRNAQEYHPREFERFSISQGGGSASFSSQRGSANANYAAVSEQSGIQAGSGGFDVDVKRNTDLKAAYIASDADPSKNTLTTGTLPGLAGRGTQVTWLFDRSSSYRR